jgi:hypothetical protein
MTSEEYLEELLIRFENFRCLETSCDEVIYTVYLRAFDYYVATHEKVQQDKAVSFASFVAGYLKAKSDVEQGVLLKGG